MMDSHDERQTRGQGSPNAIIRCCVVLVLTFVVFVLMSLLVGLMAVLLTDSWILSPISVPSRCRIVSSSVDLRSYKICELGLLNYKAKDVFYPSERNKFRCRYDYYWASVFKVEFKDHFSGQTRIALAEAPNEALPLNCRPNFGAPWLTKDKFKVNETYNCWYSSGISKVSLYSDGFFSCRAQDPSAVEMIRRYSVLCSKILDSWLSNSGRAIYLRWEMVAGVVTGSLSSLITIVVFRFVKQLISWVFSICSTRVLVRLKRACFFVAYFSVVGLLAIQYGKRFGLPEISSVLKTR